MMENERMDGCSRIQDLCMQSLIQDLDFALEHYTFTHTHAHSHTNTNKYTHTHTVFRKNELDW